LLLQGAGAQYNRIAGPFSFEQYAQNGVNPFDGVMLARIRTDQSLADFEGVNAGDFIPPQPTPPKPPATTFGGPGGLLSPDYDPPPEIPTPKPKPPATTFPTSPVDAFIPRPGGPLPPLPPLPPPPIPPEGGAWPPAGGGPEGGEGPDPTWPEGTSPPPPAPGGAEPPSLLRAALPFAVGAGALGLFLMLR